MNQPERTARDYAQTSLRDLTTRYFDLLEADLHDRRSGKIVTLGRALDRLAVSEAISRYVKDSRQVDVLAAVNAGASWRTVADALDVPVTELRADFNRWVESQRALYDALKHERPDLPPIGMSPAQVEATQRLDRDASQLDERGQRLE